MSYRLAPVAKTSSLLAGAVFLGAVVLGATGAVAGDDGQAPIWVGVGSIFGWNWGADDKKDPIDYREHGKIVLPPKMDLPQPGAPIVKSAGVWPTDPDVESRKNEKEKEKAPNPSNGYVPVKQKFVQGFDSNTVVTVRASAGQGPGASCPDGQCESSGLKELNPLGWFGGDRKPLGPEPSRAWLTDPPKGYRAPYSASTTADAQPNKPKALDPHITQPAWTPDNSN